MSEEERNALFDILNEYSSSGSSSLLTNMYKDDFEEIPVDITTFLHDRKYLGNGLIDPEGRFTLFPYWEEKLKEIFPNNVETAYNTLILTGAIGLGKAQPLDSLVLTDSGFKKMGELTLNDKVFGNDGELHTLLGIFPQGKQKICKVTFNDRTSTVCCDEHLWTVYNTHTKKWTTIATKQLVDGSRNIHMDNNRKWNAHRYKIPITKPIKFKHKDLFIHPYILGVLLGDGSIAHKGAIFTNPDNEIVEKVKSLIDNDYTLNSLPSSKYSYSIVKKKKTCIRMNKDSVPIQTPNLYVQEIEKLGINVTSTYKFIPKDYLYNDVDSRIELLHGLMDTDGYINNDGSVIEYYTVSEKLKDDVVWLVQSLGGVCKVRTKTPTFTDSNGNKRQGKLCYNIGIKLPKSISPFYLSRKKERINEKAFEPSRFIESIEYVGEQECQCIYIDSKEHLYLTNDFIVTHNTLVACLCLLYMLYRLLCLKDPYLYYGMQPIDKLSISLMNITLENAKGVALDKMNQLILSSEWFMNHGKMSGTTNLNFIPDKHIEIVIASSNNQVIGRAIFCLDGDVEVVTDDGVYKLKDIVDKKVRFLTYDGKEAVYSDYCTVKPTIISNKEYHIELEDGTILKCTPNHKFMLKDGTYKEAQYLTEYDELMDYSIIKDLQM